MLLRTCFALFVVAGAWAQQTHPAKPPQKRDDLLTRSSFTAKGLHHEDDLTDLFVGKFADLPFDRGSGIFSVLFEQYMEAYARHCDAYLPKNNRVEMTRQECAYRPPRHDDPTLPSPDDTCSYWRTVSLGYADPALYAAKAQLDHEQLANHLKEVLGGSKNLIGSAVDALQLTGDMDALVRLNACDGAGLRRFQENVVLFSKGKQPILLPGAPPPVTPSAQPSGVLTDSNYNRLVEDLLADQAKTWAFNRFVPGSTSRVIVSHDPTGQIAKILAKYLFSSPGRSDRTQGSVTVSFSDGIPECVYFSDAPSACLTPGRRIIARYSSGGYRDASASPPDSSPAAAAPVQPAPDRAAVLEKLLPAATRRSVNPAAPAPAASTAPAPPAPAPTLEQQLQQRAAERQRRAQKATDCRQQAAKDHPQGGVAMAQEYTSCLQAK